MLQRSSVPCSSHSRSSVQRWAPRPRAAPPAPHRSAPPPALSRSVPRYTKHPQHGTAPTPLALRSTHPCRQCPCSAAQCQASLQPSHRPALCLSACTDPASLRLCLLPSSRGKTTQGRFWGSRSGHPLQHPVPAGDIAAHGSTVWGIDPSLPCPLTIRSKIAYTSLWVIPRSCLPRLGPLPCGLALGTCTAEIGALQRLSLDLQTDPSSSYVCGKTHVGQTLIAPYLLFHYCSIATFSCYKEMFMIYNKINPEIVLLYGC